MKLDVGIFCKWIFEFLKNHDSRIQKWQKYIFWKIEHGSILSENRKNENSQKMKNAKN